MAVSHLKTREIHNHHMDSTRWNEFEFRDDDIIVGTYAKSGTTWTQQIISQLIFDGDESVSMHDHSPWVDMRIVPYEAMMDGLKAQQHRRVIKTHLPVDALKMSDTAKYIYIARDGRDVAWSFHNHLYRATDEFYSMMNDTPGLVGARLERPGADIREFYYDWLRNDGFPLWSFWENIRTWWEVRNEPNVRLIHFSNLKADMPGEIRKLADFLEISPSDEGWPMILEHCSFDYMKANPERSAPLGGALWDGGGGVFINKGQNGRWRDTLTDEDCAEYDAMAETELGAECAHWLKTGEIV